VLAAVERGLLVYLILEPCQQLAARRPPGDEFAGIVEHLRAAMAEMVAGTAVATIDLAVPIGAHAVDILLPLERSPPLVKLLAALYLVQSLVLADRFVLDAGSTFDNATLRLIAFALLVRARNLVFQLLTP